MHNIVSVWESVKRHWVAIVVATAVCTAAGTASSFLKDNGEVSVAATYKAEATIYVDGYEASQVEDYNYVMSESWLVSDARRVVVSNEVAGEVRRELGEDVMIEVPFWIDRETNDHFSTRFVFVDATAPSLDLAKQAANLAAEKAVEQIEKHLPVSSVEIVSEAVPSTTSKGAADFGADALAPDEAAPVTSAINKKNVLLGFAGGLFLSVLAFAAYDILSRRFRSTHDVEKILDVPVLVTLAGRPDGNAFLAEDVRVLLEKNALENVAVAGFVKGDGADAVARDLAHVLGDSIVEAGSLKDDPACVQRIARADSVLLVLSYSAAKRADIAWAVEQMKVAGTPILGAVFRPKAVSSTKRA